MDNIFQLFDPVRLIKTRSRELDGKEALVLGHYMPGYAIIMFGTKRCAGPAMIISEYCLEKVND